MNSSDLQHFLTTHAISAEMVYMQVHTPTVETAAQALGVHVDQVIKSIVLLADESPLLVIANGTSRIDLKRVADHLNLPRKKIKMADAETVLNITGYIVGSMPPFGHKTVLRTLIDSRVFDQTLIYGGGGEINAMLKIAPIEIERVTRGVKVDVV
ncbi:MAG: YbaK/EbsC family protein [Chloroflexota bacterium]